MKITAFCRERQINQHQFHAWRPRFQDQHLRIGFLELVPVVPVLLHQRAAYSHAINSGHSVQEYDPQGKAAEEIRALYKRIMKS